MQFAKNTKQPATCQYILDHSASVPMLGAPQTVSPDKSLCFVRLFASWRGGDHSASPSEAIASLDSFVIFREHPARLPFVNTCAQSISFSSLSVCPGSPGILGVGVHSAGSKGNIALPVSLREVPVLMDYLRVSCRCASVGAGLEGGKTALGSTWMMTWLV